MYLSVFHTTQVLLICIFILEYKLYGQCSLRRILTPTTHSSLLQLPTCHKMAGFEVAQALSHTRAQEDDVHQSQLRPLFDGCSLK